MPFTLTCPACTSRFTLSDELYRRKVVGNLVTVTCRHCSAEIAVDATEPATLPSHDVPRRAPSPPRPKLASVTTMGLGPAPAPAGLVNEGSHAAPPAPSATATPHWPRAPHPPRKPKKDDELELIEAEEIPASSPGAPTLDELKLEASHADPAPVNRAPDDFLVDLSAGTQGILSAPTIDLSSLSVAASASTQRNDLGLDIVGEEEVEPYEPPRVGRGGTVPLFDMSAVLPAATSNSGLNPSRSSGSAAAHASDAPASLSLPAPESKPRERKRVVAPQTPTAPAAAPPKTKRAGAGLWFGMVAVAAGVLAVVGLRGHRPEARVAPEPSAEPSTARATNEISSAKAAQTAVQDSLVATSSAPEGERSAPRPATAHAPSVAFTARPLGAPSEGTSTKLGPARALEKPEPASKPAPSGESAPPAEKPSPETEAAPSKPIEAHNAPPPAADGTEFDRAAARNALASAAAEASSCRKDGDPSGTATITITFAPSGRVTSANLQGPPFAGTATGGCIANTMRHASVPAFSGEHVTVTKTIVVQ
jgi:hypothetical protein